MPDIPKDVAVAALLWIVLGVAAILCHEERIKVVKASGRASQKSINWLYVTFGALALFYIVGCCASFVRIGDFILLHIDDPAVQDQVATWTLVAWTLGSLFVPAFIYVRHLIKSKNPATSKGRPQPYCKFYNSFL